MRQELSQTLSQKLQQRLSPLQLRFVRMLEMSELEFEEEVRRELDDNPALAEAEGQELPASDPDSEGFDETPEQMQLADYRDEEEIPFYRLEANNRSADDEYFEPTSIAPEATTLIDNLTAQLGESDLEDGELLVAQYVIGNLDDNGYMTLTPAQILDDLAFGAGIDLSMEELKRILEVIRSLDPAGVGAYDLRDCLLLQLRRMPEGGEVALATEIVEDYFDLFSLRHFDRLESLTGRSREELREAVRVIKRLDPKPAGQLSESTADDRSRHIVPDFYVELDDSDPHDEPRLVLTMPNSVPELAIEESFAVSAEGVRRAEEKSFIQRKREEAQNFIDVMRARRETLFKVMSAILNIQRQFFVTEDEATLRPMILKDVEQRTGFDLSVISRATTGKYVATPTAVYPLKFFFNERVGSSPSDDDPEGGASTHQVLAAIRRVIGEEDPQRPLSDDALTERLAAEGFDIARRTVAKYRERLGIPVARLRKKL